jgi:hypothetical protein
MEQQIIAQIDNPEEYFTPLLPHSCYEEYLIGNYAFPLAVVVSI